MSLVVLPDVPVCLFHHDGPVHGSELPGRSTTIYISTVQIRPALLVCGVPGRVCFQQYRNVAGGLVDAAVPEGVPLDIPHVLLDLRR